MQKKILPPSKDHLSIFHSQVLFVPSFPSLSPCTTYLSALAPHLHCVRKKERLNLLFEYCILFIVYCILIRRSEAVGVRGKAFRRNGDQGTNVEHKKRASS